MFIQSTTSPMSSVDYLEQTGHDFWKEEVLLTFLIMFLML